MGEAWGRARLTRGEGARSWVAGGGSSAFQGRGPQSVLPAYGRGRCGRGLGRMENRRTQLLRGKVFPESACPGGGAQWFGRPAGEGSARGGWGQISRRNQNLCTRVNPLPHDSRRTRPQARPALAKGVSGEAPRLTPLSRPKPVVWAESGSSLAGSAALRLPGRDEPGAPPVGRARARWGLLTGGPGHPGDPGVQGP